MKKIQEAPWMIIFFVMTFLMPACTSEFEGPFPEGEQKPTVNATLAADSLIQIKLSWPRTPGDTSEFAPVSNAQISLWENDSLLGQASEYTKGIYILEHTINPGCSYRMEANIDKWGIVSAETFVPLNIKSSVKEKENPQGEIDNKHYLLTFGKAGKNTSGVWLLATSYTKKGIPVEQSVDIYSNTTLADNFNRAYDATAPDGYFSLYEFFIRIHPENLQNDSTSVTFNPSGDQEDEFIFILTAGRDYDKYFKAIWMEKSENASDGLNAFFYYPNFPYSNIKNGYGIFAGYNIQRFQF
ncbi:MAG: DUF4249 family protein [Marinilabiliaceae bacterium]